MNKLIKFMQTARLPVMPEVAAKLTSTFAADHVDITFLRDVISKDPTVTATVLRLANSPLHGLSRSVKTLDSAISILGVSKVRAQAIAICMANSAQLPKGMSRESFWTHSMKCAGYSMWLGLAVGLDESEAWLTGILLRLGEVLIGQVEGYNSRVTNALDVPASSRWQLERDSVGFDEGQVMAEAVKTWLFPQEIVKALRDCSSPLSAKKFSALAAVVHLAATLSEMKLVDEDALKSLPHDVVFKLGVDIDWIAQHLPDAMAFTDTSMLG